MNILTGIETPFEVKGQRQRFSFCGDEAGGQFQVEVDAGTSVQGSWDYQHAPGQSNFYFDLSVTNVGKSEPLGLSLTRCENGSGQLHIRRSGGLEVVAPVGDLSRADEEVFECLRGFNNANDIMLETYDDGISLAVYQAGAETGPAHFVFRDGTVRRD